jgi:thermostable 8-oxoguanine DNA glycosylase
MIDPVHITNFNQTDEQLEEVLLFWVLVAGKTASIISKALEKILNSLPGSTPFEKIRGVERNNLPKLLKDHGIGCFNLKARALWELVNSNLNLRTCSVEDLEKIYGIGSKTARCFIVHSRPNSNHACLDTHVLKFLRAKGHKVSKGTPSSKKQYKELEQVFLNYVKKSGKSVAEFDLEVWNSYANGGINYGR